MHSTTTICASTQRVYDRADPGAWLVTLMTGLQRADGKVLDENGWSMDAMPQCWCVIDDFGSLVPVRGWL